MPGLRTKVGTYAAALFLLKDTFKESVDDPDVFEKEFVKFLKENDIELDDEISEEVKSLSEIIPIKEFSFLLSYTQNRIPILLIGDNDNAEFFIIGVSTFGYARSPLILIDGIETTSTD